MHKAWQTQDTLSKTEKGTLMAGGGILAALAGFGFLAMRKKEG